MEHAPFTEREVQQPPERMKTKISPKTPAAKVVALPRLVRRCYNCIHAGRGFKLTGKTHHYCSHPAMVAGIRDDDRTAWDTLVEWHFRCDNWEAKLQPNEKADLPPTEARGPRSGTEGAIGG